MKTKCYGLCQTKIWKNYFSAVSTIDYLFPFNVGLNYLFPSGRSVAFVILLFGDKTKICPAWKGYWIKSQICHRFIYHRHLPPVFSDCMSQLMPVTEFFLPHQSDYENIYIYMCMCIYMCTCRMYIYMYM